MCVAVAAGVLLQGSKRATGTSYHNLGPSPAVVGKRIALQP